MKNLAPILVIGSGSKKIIKHAAGICTRYHISPAHQFWFNSKYETLTIQELRNIVAFSYKPKQGLSAIIICGIDTAGETGQNTLLKTLEEHNSNILFIITSEFENNIIPTVLSRCIIEKVESLDYSLTKSLPNDWEQLIDSYEKNKTILPSIYFKLNSKNKEKALALINECLIYIKQKYFNNKTGTNKKRIKTAAYIAKQGLIVSNDIRKKNIDPITALDQLFI